MRINSGIEALRLISAFLVVWFHAGLSFGHEISYSGLIVFVVLSVHFSFTSHVIGVRYLDRFQRYLYPWLVWSLFYGVANVYSFKPFIDLSRGQLYLVLSGTHIHLWYLPYMFLMLLAVDYVKRNYHPLLICVISFISFIAFVMFAPMWRPLSFDFGAPFSQYMHAFGAILIGSYIWSSKSLPFYSRLFADLSLLIAIVVSYADSGVFVPYLVGYVICLIALRNNFVIPWGPKISWLSSGLFGVYLMHPIFIHLGGRLGLDHLIPLFAFISSLFIVLLLRYLLPSHTKYLL